MRPELRAARAPAPSRRRPAFADPVTLPAVADRTPAVLEGCQARDRELHDRDEAEEQAGPSEIASVNSTTIGSMAISSTRGKPSGATTSRSNARRPRRGPGRARRPPGRASRSRRAARGRSASGPRRAPSAWRAPAAVLPPAPGTGSPRWRTRSAARSPPCRAAPTAPADVADDVERQRPHVGRQARLGHHLLGETRRSGNPSRTIGIMRAMSALACSSVTPGLRRASPWYEKFPTYASARLNRMGRKARGPSAGT